MFVGDEEPILTEDEKELISVALHNHATMLIDLKLYESVDAVEELIQKVDQL